MLADFSCVFVANTRTFKDRSMADIAADTLSFLPGLDNLHWRRVKRFHWLFLSRVQRAALHIIFIFIFSFLWAPVQCYVTDGPTGATRLLPTHFCLLAVGSLWVPDVLLLGLAKPRICRWEYYTQKLVNRFPHITPFPVPLYFWQYLIAVAVAARYEWFSLFAVHWPLLTPYRDILHNAKSNFWQ